MKTYIVYATIKLTVKIEAENLEDARIKASELMKNDYDEMSFIIGEDIK
jgi:hypothetical protein